jgi:hypothetical protein
MNEAKKKEQQIFNDIKSSFLDIDPAYFIQNNLKLDGEEFRIIGNGWKFMADMYRYIALQATQKTGKPIVIKKGRQVGATMMAGALDLLFTNSSVYKNMRVLHAFPALHFVKRFSQDKLESLIRHSKDNFIEKNKLKSANAADNLTMKQFLNGTLWIDSIGDDADRIRGMTVDAIFFDECQDMLGQSIGNAKKILTAAKYGAVGSGIQVYFGTPKENNSYFSSMWDISDQRYYHLGCKNCKKTFPFYLPGSKDWMDIWVSGFTIKCPLCSCEQTKIDAIERGKWVATKSAADSKYIGFHINQLYIPYFSKENILDLMPENNPLQIERIYKNEVLGEFYSGAGMPISKAEIYEKCRDADRSMSKKISPREKITYLGVDWGGKDDGSSNGVGQSYSCVVILSAMPNGTLLIEHAHKLKRQDFDYKKETIHEMYKRFGIKTGISDWFFGQDVVHDLQKHYGPKFLGAQGSGNLIKPLKFREDELIVSYNKDLVIDEMFDAFRKGKIRFPWKSFEYIEWLIDHCTSMDSAIRVVGGQPVKTYVKGTTPNDGLMALMYAYMAYKFDLTKGFTIKPGINDTGGSMPKPVLAHIGRRV